MYTHTLNTLLNTPHTIPTYYTCVYTLNIFWGNTPLKCVWYLRVSPTWVCWVLGVSMYTLVHVWCFKHTLKHTHLTVCLKHCTYVYLNLNTLIHIHMHCVHTYTHMCTQFVYIYMCINTQCLPYTLYGVCLNTCTHVHTYLSHMYTDYMRYCVWYHLCVTYITPLYKHC